MTENKINPILFPQVSSLQSSKNKKTNNEFKEHLDHELNHNEIKISNHAAKRIIDRNLDLNGEEFVKIRNAITKLKEKGGKDSLVITSNAAYIVDVNQNKIVTAIDKENLQENIFTKIDSTILMN